MVIREEKYLCVNISAQQIILPAIVLLNSTPYVLDIQLVFERSSAHSQVTIKDLLGSL